MVVVCRARVSRRAGRGRGVQKAAVMSWPAYGSSTSGPGQRGSACGARGGAYRLGGRAGRASGRRRGRRGRPSSPAPSSAAPPRPWRSAWGAPVPAGYSRRALRRTCGSPALKACQSASVWPGASAVLCVGTGARRMGAPGVLGRIDGGKRVAPYTECSECVIPYTECSECIVPCMDRTESIVPHSDRIASVIPCTYRICHPVHISHLLSRKGAPLQVACPYSCM